MKSIVALYEIPSPYARLFKPGKYIGLIHNYALKLRADTVFCKIELIEVHIFFFATKIITLFQSYKIIE